MRFIRKQLESKRILVTGASGFIGGAIARTLAGGLCDGVVALCRDTGKGRARLGRLAENVEFISWNMADPVPEVGRVDGIVHAAGCGDPALYASAPFTIMRDAFSGCANLADFAVSAGTKPFVLVSSGEVYGNVSGTGRIKENQQGSVDVPAPRSSYPISKAACESMCLAAGRERGLSVRIARLCHVYGPGMGTDDSRIAAQFPLAAASGKDIVLKSAGEQLRSFCHIADAARGILTLLARGAAGQVYNVADEGVEMTVLRFAEKIAEAAGVKVRIELADKNGQGNFNPMARAVFETGKLRDLGWSPCVGFADGLATTLEYFRTTATETA